MTGGSPLARAARLCAVLAAPLLALAAAPAAAQVTVSVISTPVNGQYYVAGETISTRISGIAAAIMSDATSVISNCLTRNPDVSTSDSWRCNWMQIDIGGVTREARIVINPFNRTSVDYQYTVQAADADSDGISIPANSIVGKIWRRTHASSGPVQDRNHAALAAQSGHRVDGDGAAVRFSIDSPRVAEGGAGDTPTMTFTVTLSQALTVQATVNYNDYSGGTATSGTDYTAVTAGTLTFAAGVTSQTVSVTVTGDATAESDETIDLQLGSPTPTGVVVVSGMEVGRGTIVDDDRPTLTIDSPRVAEGNSGTTEMTFTVTLSPASTGQVTVEWEDLTTRDGTAEAGSDYTALSPSSGTLTFAAGETSKTIAVEVRGDSEIEPDETVVVGINTPNPSGTPIRDADGAIAAFAVGVGTITNDDTPPPPPPSRPAPPPAEKLVLSVEELEVAAGAAGASYTLRLGARPTGPVEVAVSSDNPDVTASPAALSFDASNWRAPQTVTVTAAADGDDYVDTARLTHTARGGGLDGETAVVAALVSEAGDVRVRAPAAGAPAAAYMVGAYRFEVRAEAGVPPGVEIVPPAMLTADLTVTLRAVSDDVSPAPGVFAFGAGAAQVAVDVSVTGVPSAGLELCLPASAALRAASGGRALTLLRHDGAAWAEVAGARLDAAAARVCASGITEFSPFAVGWRRADAPAVAPPPPPPPAETLVLSVEELAVAAGAAGAVYTLRLDGAPMGPVEVAISSDNPDVAASPAALAFGASDWSAPQTVTVTAAADADDYADAARLIPIQVHNHPLWLA